MSKIDDDLSRIETEISKSRQGFLDAVEEYDPADSKKVMDDFVTKFLKEELDWSDTTREHADEVLAQDRKFDEKRTSLTEKIAMAAVNMNGSVLTLQRRILEQGMHVFDTAPGNPGSIGWLTEQKKDMDARTKAFDSAGENAKKNAYAMGVYIEALQNKATDLIRLRARSIKAFKTRNLEINFHDILERLREEIREEGITEALKKTAEILAERLKELAEVLGGQAPMLRILIAIRKAAKVFDKKKPKPDLTNELGKLVDLMKKENAAYEAIEKAFDQTMLELDRLANAPL